MRPVVRLKRAFCWIRHLLLLALIGVLLFGSQSAKAQDDAHLYMPAIQGPPPPALYGTVTYQGTPIAGITLDLWRYSSVDPVVVATTVTGSDGSYQFLNAPPLGSDEAYAARYTNRRPGGQRNDQFAGSCETFFLDDYKGGTVHLGDFDIDNMWEVKPEHGSTVKLPVTFTWTHAAPAAGKYSLGFFPTEQGDEQYQSPPVAGVKSYTLQSLPAGFSYNKTYGWLLFFDTDQSFCVSYYSSYVTFKK